MTARTTPPFRADHVGSLLRPPALLAVRDRYARGEASADELRAAEDTAVREAVALQEGVGLRLATDGEFRRESWNMDFLFELGGIGHDEQPRPTEWHTRSGTLHADFPAVKVNGPIRLEQTIFGDHFAFLQSAVTTTVPKLSIPSPNMLRSLQRNRDEPGIGPYTDIDAFWADVTTAYQAEIRALHAQGCRYLQLDDTSFAMFSDPGRREGIKAQGGDPDRAHLDHIATMNAALAGGRPAWSSPRIPAAATSGPGGAPRAATTSSPRRCSASWTSTGSSSSTTTSARAVSSRSASCRRGRWWCSAW